MVGEKKKKSLLCNSGITDILDKQSRAVTYMQTHTHPLRNKNLRSKKSCTKQERSEHTFNICYWGTRKASLHTERHPETHLKHGDDLTFFGKQPAFQLHSFHLILRAGEIVILISCWPSVFPNKRETGYVMVSWYQIISCETATDCLLLAKQHYCNAAFERSRTCKPKLPTQLHTWPVRVCEG